MGRRAPGELEIYLVEAALVKSIPTECGHDEISRLRDHRDNTGGAEVAPETARMAGVNFILLATRINRTLRGLCEPDPKKQSAAHCVLPSMKKDSRMTVGDDPRWFVDSQDSQLREARLRPTATLFSSRDIVAAWCRHVAVDRRPLAIEVKGSGPKRVIYAFEKPNRYGSRYLNLGSHYFTASPGWEGRLEPTTLDGILRSLTGFRSRGFEWHVPFDDQHLASGLVQRGLSSVPSPTMVIDLQRDYERVFSQYSATIRKEVRRAYRRGVTVRDAREYSDVQAYYDVYRQLVELRTQRAEPEFHWRWVVYPIDLFVDLMNARCDKRFLIAEYEGKVIAGGVFLSDGFSVVGFSLASDRSFSHLFPSCAVLDTTIRWACESGMATLDMMGSGPLTPVQKFKDFWGARPETNLIFRWANPHWRRLQTLNSRVRRLIGELKESF